MPLEEVSENVWISNELIASVRFCISQMICKSVGGDGWGCWLTSRDWQEVPGVWLFLVLALVQLLPLLDELRSRASGTVRRPWQTA